MAEIYSKADMKKELLRVFKKFAKPFTRREYEEISEIDPRTVERAFGTWGKALQECGLAEKFESFRAVEKEVKDFAPEKELAEDWQNKKKDLLLRADRRQLEKIRAQHHKVDILKDMLEEAIAKAEPPVFEVQPVKVVVPKLGKERPNCTLWFEFSDLQLGTLISSESMGGLNKHNWIIWQEKLQVWKRLVIDKITTYLQTHTVDQVVIACLGDMVEGQDIFKGQVWQIDRNVVDQAIEGSNDVSATFIEIMLTFKDLQFDILEVFGNHGRTQRKGEAPYACSMDKVFQRFLEAQIGKAGVTNVRYHRNEAWFYLVEIYGWNHLLLHGDQGMSSLWSSRPTINGLEKGMTRYNQMMQQQIQFLHAGHYHQAWSLSFNMCQMMINGSFIGTSQFSASQMVSASPALQVMHVFYPRQGLGASEYLHLSEGLIRKPYEPNTLMKQVDRS